MSLKGIFGLFGLPEDDNNSYRKKEELDESLDVFQETPYFKIGMFCKMINNGKNFTTQIKKFLNTSSDPIDLTGIDEAGEMMMYSRALSWIEECDLKIDDWKSAIQEHKNKDNIKYYESLEEYETCSFLKKIQDFASNHSSQKET